MLDNVYFIESFYEKDKYLSHTDYLHSVYAVVQVLQSHYTYFDLVHAVRVTVEWIHIIQPQCSSYELVRSW